MAIFELADMPRKIMEEIKFIGGKDNKLKDYAKELKTTIEKSHDAFEKQLNYISSGSLGLSIALIEKVVKDLNLTAHNWILISSWSLFVLTLTSNLIHIYTHQRFIQKQSMKFIMKPTIIRRD